MKVKELIQELSKCNPEDDAIIVADETGSFGIVNVFVEDGVVYIEGD